ncbi:rhodanese-like domain-containing protein [Nocardioides sp.]|uniref:rhodanese-like domain-containing protein n=1 Tax=Nocardioides sp. TaxID=35761 RepID=UPI00262935ED|nr:rhodanese-like domain-containing protein [Nocardioides sp.]
MIYASVDELLATAREGLTRLRPAEAAAAVADGALLVDIRPAWQRESDGEIPGALIVERNHLEWRLHPGSGASLPVAVEGQRWILYCTEGYTSSLAARSLLDLGLHAADLEGGIEAWRSAGFAVRPGPTPIEQVVPTATVESA